MPSPLRIGMVGYGFMGRAHSNAYNRVNNFFDLPYKPVLQAVAARDGAKAEKFAATWGYASVETDWKKLVEREKISVLPPALQLRKDDAELDGTPHTTTSRAGAVRWLDRLKDRTVRR